MEQISNTNLDLGSESCPILPIFESDMIARILEVEDKTRIGVRNSEGGSFCWFSEGSNNKQRSGG